MWARPRRRQARPLRCRLPVGAWPFRLSVPGRSLTPDYYWRPGMAVRYPNVGTGRLGRVVAVHPITRTLIVAPWRVGDDEPQILGFGEVVATVAPTLLVRRQAPKPKPARPQRRRLPRRARPSVTR